MRYDEYGEQHLLNCLGVRVRFLRNMRRWTLERAAAEMGIDWKHLQKVESGLVNLTMRTLFRIARGLTIDTSELFETTQGDSIAARKADVLTSGSHGSISVHRKAL